MRVAIYKLDTNEKIIYTLGLLLEKLCISKKIGVLCNNDNINIFDKVLWTFSTNYFIPHDIVSDNDDYNNMQNVLLSTNLNDLLLFREILCLFNLSDIRLFSNKIDEKQKIININDIIYITYEEECVEKIKDILPTANIDLYKKQNGKWQQSMFWYDSKKNKVIYS